MTENRKKGTIITINPPEVDFATRITTICGTVATIGEGCTVENGELKQGKSTLLVRPGRKEDIPVFELRETVKDSRDLHPPISAMRRHLEFVQVGIFFELAAIHEKRIPRSNYRETYLALAEKVRTEFEALVATETKRIETIRDKNLQHHPLLGRENDTVVCTKCKRHHGQVTVVVQVDAKNNLVHAIGMYEMIGYNLNSLTYDEGRLATAKGPLDLVDGLVCRECAKMMFKGTTSYVKAYDIGKTLVFAVEMIRRRDERRSQEIRQQHAARQKGLDAPGRIEEDPKDFEFDEFRATGTYGIDATIADTDAGQKLAKLQAQMAKKEGRRKKGKGK
jgi:hypothetical protein